MMRIFYLGGQSLLQFIGQDKKAEDLHAVDDNLNADKDDNEEDDDGDHDDEVAQNQLYLS